MTAAALMTSDSRQTNFGLIAILFSSLTWGTTGTAASFAPEVSPIAIAAAAMGIGGLLQALRAQKAIRHERALLQKHWRLLLLGAICVAVYPVAFYASMRLAGVAIGTVISIASAPIFAALIERFFERRPLVLRWLVSAAISIAGVVLITFSLKSGNSSSSANWGVILGLIAGLTYAAYTWSARAMMMRGNSSAAAMGATFGLGGLLLMPLLAASGAAFFNSWSNAAIGAYMALVPMFLGYVAFGYGLARVTASTATMITLTEPVIAALFAVFLLGENLSLWGWLGMIAVALGLLVLTLPLKRRGD